MAEDLNVNMRCVKYMLFISNFMFVMVGILLISFGSTIKSIYYNFEAFMEEHYFSPAILTVAIGVIILLIAAFGCVAALKESTCMVNMYALLLLLVLVLEVSASIAAYSMRANIEVFMHDKMTDALTIYSYNNDTKTMNAVDDMQSSLNCCGIDNAEDWIPYTGSSLPRSCCNDKPKYNRPADSDKTCKISGYGCLNELSYIVKQSSIMLGTGALCIALVQVLGVAFAVMLAKSIRRIKTERAARSWQTRQELYLTLARGNEKPATTTATTPVVYTHESGSSEA